MRRSLRAGSATALLSASPVLQCPTKGSVHNQAQTGLGVGHAHRGAAARISNASVPPLVGGWRLGTPPVAKPPAGGGACPAARGCAAMPAGCGPLRSTAVCRTPHAQNAHNFRAFESEDDLQTLLNDYDVPEGHRTDIEGAPDWETKSGLALLACSAMFHNEKLGDKPGDLQMALDDVKGIGDNAVFLRQAKLSKLFSFSLFECVRHECLGDLFQKPSMNVANVGTTRVLAIACSHPSCRHIGDNTDALVSLPPIDFQEISPDTSKLLLSIVSGESGSGKTCSSIAAAESAKALCLFHAPDWGIEKDLRAVRDLHGTEADAKKMMDGKVSAYLAGLIASLKVTKESDRTAVLVLDEVGMAPLLLQTLCRSYTSIIERLKQLAKVAHFFIIAAGTGIDTATTQPGSSVGTYRIYRMTTESGEEFLKAMLPRCQAQVQAMVKANSAYRIGREAFSLLTNRRIAAAFVRTEAGKEADVDGLSRLNLDFRFHLSSTLNRAIAAFKALNGFRGCSGQRCMQLFARALAISMGDQTQTLEPHDQQLLYHFGILVDNAERRKGTAGDGELVVPSEPVAGECVVLRPGTTTRYSMSVAVTEMGLRAFGVVQRPYDGLGFEETIRDFLMVQVLAGSSNVTIASGTPVDVLTGMKCHVRANVKDVKVILCLSLKKAAGTIQEVKDICSAAIISEVQARLDVKNAASKAKVAVVIKNCPLAPAADLYCVVFTVEKKNDSQGYGCSVETDDLQMAIQLKKHDTTTLTPFEGQAELYKMGDRRPLAILGHIAATIRIKDLRSKKQLKMLFVEKYCVALTHAQVLSLTRLAKKKKKKQKNVPRTELYTQLITLLLGQMDRTPPPLDRCSYWLLAAQEKPGIRDAHDPAEIVVAPSAAFESALRPVLFMEEGVAAVAPGVEHERIMRLDL